MTTFAHPELDRQIDPEIADMAVPLAILHGYVETKRDGSDILILSDYALHENDVPKIVQWLREHGIDRAALTTGSSALKRTLWAFWQAGCTLSMREIPGSKYTSYDGSPQVATIVHL